MLQPLVDAKKTPAFDYPFCQAYPGYLKWVLTARRIVGKVATSRDLVALEVGESTAPRCGGTAQTNSPRFLLRYARSAEFWVAVIAEL